MASVAVSGEYSDLIKLSLTDKFHTGCVIIKQPFQYFIAAGACIVLGNATVDVVRRADLHLASPSRFSIILVHAQHYIHLPFTVLERIFPPKCIETRVVVGQRAAAGGKSESQSSN